MKRTIVAFTSGLVLGMAILSMVQKTQPVSAAIAMAAPIPAGSAAAMPMSHCPNIHHAIDALQKAEDDMTKAGHDFCGHKEMAIRATGRAMEQLRLAENCDQCK
jgi:hypothetical protein